MTALDVTRNVAYQLGVPSRTTRRNTATRVDHVPEEIDGAGRVEADSAPDGSRLSRGGQPTCGRRNLGRVFRLETRYNFPGRRAPPRGKPQGRSMFLSAGATRLRLSRPINLLLELLDDGPAAAGPSVV